MNFIRKHCFISIIAIIGIVIFFDLLVFFTDTAYAQKDNFGLQVVEDQGIGISDQPIDVTIAKLIRILLGFLGLLAVIIVIYGGYMYMTSAGDEDRMTRAKLILKNGIIGLTVILFSFIIVQFIIQKLMGATGIDSFESVDSTCTDVAGCNNSSCYINTFGVQSITPSQDKTGMNNIVVRAVFSKGVATSPGEVLSIFLGPKAIDIANNFTFSFVPGTKQKVIEGIYTFDEDRNSNCNVDNFKVGKGCVPVSIEPYYVEVKDNIVALDGQGIAFGQVCEDFNSIKNINFTVDEKKNDIVPPLITEIGVIDPDTDRQYTEVLPYLISGKFYTMKVDTDDNNGIGYVHMRVEAIEDSNDVIDIYRGPPAGSSSADPYVLAEKLFLSSGISKKWGKPKEYLITATVWDIDSNSTVATSSFVLIGSHCNNGKMDANETGVDTGGSCGSGIDEPCQKDVQCASGKCIDSKCVAYPKITDVDPMNGASGNWVTIIGNYFGRDEGNIEFGSNDTGWIKANLVKCPGVLDGDTWHDSFAIVEVPESGTVKLEENAISFGGNTESGYAVLSMGGRSIDIKEFSLGMWIRMPSSKKERKFFSVGNSETEVYFVAGSNNDQVSLLQKTDGVVDSVKANVKPLNLDDWNFFTFSESPHKTDKNKVTRNFSINGRTYASYDFNIPDFSSGGEASVRLGSSLDAQEPATMIFDEVVLYDKGTLPKDFYKSLEQRLNNSSEYKSYVLSNNPIAYWRLNKKDISDGVATILDQVTNKVGGTLHGIHTINIGGIFGTNQLEIPSVSEVAIRITTADGKYSDTTIDTYGPKPVYIDPVSGKSFYDGLFRYNDIHRPGLCAVVVDGKQGDVADGSIVGPPGTNIRAHGTGFEKQTSGDQILFNIKTGKNSTLIAGDVSDWTEELIRTSIPINILPGSPLVKVKKSLEFSNGVPFKVTKTDLSDIKPFITDIDPEDPTPGSFVTIYGNNFGSAGIVYITKQKGAVCSLNNPVCIPLDPPPLPCENSWTNTQIVVDIKENFDKFGDYYVIVQRADNQLQSDGLVDILSVQKGQPKPSICSLSPIQGPAPLPESHNGLIFKGKNFTTTPILYFWNGSKTYDTKIEEDKDLESSGAWIGWNGSDPSEKRWIVDAGGTQIISSVAYQKGSSHPTMPFGQWPITIKANGQKGNSVKYFVSDCRFQKEAPNNSVQCCTEGPDTGSWKEICDGEVRTAGYVWRFTTGIFPNTPHVLVQCDEVNWHDKGGYDGKNPSPIPSVEWEESKDMCLNATAQVAFSMGISGQTVSDKTVLVYQCGKSSGDIDCDYGDEDLLTDLDLKYEPGDEPLLLIKKGYLSDKPNFKANTWHRVILTTGISSSEQDIGAGATSSVPLRIDRPLPEYKKDTVAFYYDFQTGNGFCTLNSAFITPKEKTVSQLGILKDKWYSNLPFYYYLKGRADRKCTVLSVDKLGWQWKSDKPERGDISVSPSPDYIDSRATSTAKLHTPEGIEFSAKTVPSSSLEILFPPDGVIIAETSTLYINLGKPQVVYYEPNCSEACPNGKIFAKFNRHIDPQTFTKDNIILSKCKDPNCIGLEKVQYAFDNANSTDPNDWLYIKITPSSPLDFDKYYKVVLNEGVKSLGKLSPPTSDGEELKYHEWIFKTKKDGTLCAVDNVKVKPHPFIATFIGQKSKFTATPYGAPGECSATGQELNNWDTYEYKWSSAVPQVAEITTFKKSISKKTYCTDLCLQTGSDVSFGNKTKPLCGNKIVEAGEDCDIAVSGEIVGLTCTLECLRPGSDGKYCGNGIVDNPTNLSNNSVSAGELCDPKATMTSDGKQISLAPYCANNCKLKGSSSKFNPLVSGFCGDGKIGLEESCDVGIKSDNTLDTNQSLGCSDTCLHIGTSLTAQWCENESLKKNVINAKYVTEEQVKNACNSSLSVCGNGILELGEQCERTEQNKKFCSPLCLFYDGDMSDNNTKGGQIGICGTEYKQCDAGTEGCTGLCTYAGSSVYYSTPSLCGDSKQGIGEERMKNGASACEISTADGSGIISSEAPLQIATAIGKGVVTGGTQKTDIKVKMPKESKNNVPVEGMASYTLQCGFTEFAEPQNGFYNDCVTPQDSNILPNGLGVGINSCCYPRPFREAEYPLSEAGLGNEEPVCRNTYIEVTFNKEINPSTITDNAKIARGYDIKQNCASLGGEDVTTAVGEALGLNSSIADVATDGFWTRLWNGVKRLFFKLFGGDVNAKDILLKNIKTWCTEDIFLTTGMYEPSKKVPLYISNVLGKDSEHTVYAVLLEGGKNGISDLAGVGMKHKEKVITHDAWAFEVGTKICKLDKVAVYPSSYLFTRPNTSTDFGADGISYSGQLIVPTPPYNWKWAWQPQISSIFDIPSAGYPSDKRLTKLGSTNVEGAITAVAQSIITADLSTEDNHLGKIFEGKTKLTSMFCENPWPAVDGVEWYPYQDEQYNFSFSYCADAGQSGVLEDDLPFLESKTIENLLDNSLKKTLFVSETNTDGIGIQIFENSNRLSATEWFDKKFPTASPPQKIEIAGYDAVAYQDNYYVNALNIIRDDSGVISDVYNNIYLFSISQGSQESTRKVFKQILDSLEFNTNLTDHGYCVGHDNVTPDYVNTCSTNFDCILGSQTVVLSEEKAGVCGIDTLGYWQQEPSIGEEDILALSFNDKEQGVAGGNFFAYTNDGGKSWVFGNKPTSSLLIADLSYASDGSIWATSQSDIFRNETVYGDWVSKKYTVSTGGVSFQSIQFFGDIGYVVGKLVSNKAVIYRTLDGGKTWKQVYKDTVVSTGLATIHIIDNNIAVAVGNMGNQNGYILRTIDGGETWTVISDNEFNFLLDVSFFNNVGVAVGGGEIIKSDDKGKTWKKVFDQIDIGPTSALTFKSVIFLDAMHIIAIAANGSYLKSDNGGNKWNLHKMIDTATKLHVLAKKPNGDVFLGGKNGVLFKHESLSIPCVDDSQCKLQNICIGGSSKNITDYSSLGCHAEKTKLARDWERLHDIRNIQVALYSSEIPQLNEGTFRKNYVSSVWPSWGMFGKKVGQNLSQDPINVWDGCDPADPSTCWNANDSTFVCPQYSSVYEYKYDNIFSSYLLHSPMEFFPNENFVEYAFSESWIDKLENTPFIFNTSSFTTERGCDPGVKYTFASSQCGDGVVNPGEQCDPPGKKLLGSKGAVVKTYGVCEFQPDKECLYQTDCPYIYSFSGYANVNNGKVIQKTLYAGNAGKHCVIKKDGILYRIVKDFNLNVSKEVKNSYELFACGNDSDCTDTGQYRGSSISTISVHETLDIGAYNNPFQLFTKKEFEQYLNNNKRDVVCFESSQFLGQQCKGGIPGEGAKECDSYPIQKYATKTCNNDCRWDYGICKPLNECGNGIVDAGEACDDGILNNSYGHCSKDCLGLSDAYCGNEVIDYDASGNPIEFCESYKGDYYTVYSQNSGKLRLVAPEIAKLNIWITDYLSTCGSDIFCKTIKSLISNDFKKQIEDIYKGSNYRKYCSIDTNLLCATDANCIAPLKGDLKSLEYLDKNFEKNLVYDPDLKDLGLCQAKEYQVVYNAPDGRKIAIVAPEIAELNSWITNYLNKCGTDFVCKLSKAFIADDLKKQIEDIYNGSNYNGSNYKKVCAKNKLVLCSDLENCFYPKSPSIKKLDNEFFQLIENVSGADGGVVSGAVEAGSIGPCQEIYDNVVYSQHTGKIKSIVYPGISSLDDSAVNYNSYCSLDPKLLCVTDNDCIAPHKKDTLTSLEDLTSGLTNIFTNYGSCISKEYHMTYSLDKGKMRLLFPKITNLTNLKNLTTYYIDQLGCGVADDKCLANATSIALQAYDISKVSNYKKYCSLDTKLLCAEDKDCISPAKELLIKNLDKDFEKNLTNNVVNYGKCVLPKGHLGTPYNFEKEKSCKWDCKGYGSYCGDGFIDIKYGEECDDGNSNNYDGCTNKCKIIDYACYNAIKNGLINVSVDTGGTGPKNISFDQEKGLSEILVGGGKTKIKLLYFEDDGLHIPQCVGLTGTKICQQFGLPCQDVKQLDFAEPKFVNEESIGTNACEQILKLQQDENQLAVIECNGEFNFNAQSTPKNVVPKACGNSKIDVGEQCDPSVFGTKKFADCVNIGYGKPKCTYCSEQCLIKTIEPAGFCGNGILDNVGNNKFESCEFTSEGKYVIASSTFPKGSFVASSCKDAGFGEFGKIQCLDSCIKLDKSDCGTCSPKENGALAHVSLLNVMLAKKSTSTFPMLVRLKKQDAIGKIEKFGFINTGVSSSTEANNYKNPYKRYFFYDNGDKDELRLESNFDCGAKGCDGVSCKTSGYFVDFESPINSSDYKHKFSYNVNGEKTAVTNEYILSPPVPSGVIRAVIRWRKDSAVFTSTKLFGGFYRDGGFDNNNIDILTPSSFMNAFCGDLLSDKVSNPYYGYAWPNGNNCKSNQKIIWPHNSVEGYTYNVQSFTIDLNELPMTSEPIAFFVQSIDKSIGSMTNEKIYVDVYMYDSKFFDKSSNYHPQYTYEISTAVKGIAYPNVDAKIWHVFNIIPDDSTNPNDGLLQSEVDKAKSIPIEKEKMWLVPVENMQTDDCAIKEQVYPSDEKICSST